MSTLSAQAWGFGLPTRNTHCAWASRSTYPLGEAAGWRAQSVLWEIVARGDLAIAVHEGERVERIRELMEKYRDRPMDLADASLVALAEERGLEDVFTLDRAHFARYRLHGRKAFRLWPRPS